MSKALKTIWKVITAPFRFLFWLGRGIARGFKKILSFFSEDIEDTPLPDAFAKTIENPTGILFHLNELRKHLFRAILSLVITTAISFLFITQILDFMARPLEGGIKELRAVDITESVGTVMKVSLLAGFALAFPYIIFELWMFAAP